jgi:hypothetical protein
VKPVFRANKVNDRLFASHDMLVQPAKVIISEDIMNPIAVSTWSLHRLLGVSYDNGPGTKEPFARSETWGRGELTLMELPAALAQRGYRRCEICHFHLASQSAGYLAPLRKAFEEHRVAIQTLLIDDGDITHPDQSIRGRDLAWIAGWIETAAELGSENARVIAGKQKPSRETLAHSVDGLKRMAELGRKWGVRVVTENWFDLLASPAEVHQVLDAVGDDLGFLADTGNWSGPTKYADLQQVFARSELCHSKTEFGAGLQIDADDYRACIKAGQLAGYRGPHTLIFESEGDEWTALAMERDFVMAELQR